ncbi:MAG: thioredoxin [Methanothrix sp.]|nr:thioredoxin [Methanothrix sp.]
MHRTLPGHAWRGGKSRRGYTTAKPILMDFYADWCGPCRLQAPIFEELARDYSDKAEFKKINVDKEGDLAIEKGIMVVPTIILEKDGQEIQKWMGVTSKEELIKAINKALD